MDSLGGECDSPSGACVSLDEKHVIEAKLATSAHSLLEKELAEFAASGARVDEDSDTSGHFSASSSSSLDAGEVGIVQEVSDYLVGCVCRRVLRCGRADKVVAKLKRRLNSGAA